MGDWTPDLLGDGYERLTLALGDDPDGEGTIEATLVRRPQPPEARGVVLYVHGFSDYFFQKEMADFFADRGLAFYALDLRKCGRSRREGQTAHYVSDLALYDTELDRALAVVRDETGGLPVVVAAHSTGGLVAALWLDRLRRRGGESGVAALLLNSPWFDLQGRSWMRSVGTQVIELVARVRPTSAIRLPAADAYGTSLFAGAHGEWDFEIAFKPLGGFRVTFGWLAAIRRAHAQLHRGLDVGVPSLVLRSARSRPARAWSHEVDQVDVVLDVRQIARWAGCLGDAVTSVPIDGARHDVFLSLAPARKVAYDVAGEWLDRTLAH